MYTPREMTMWTDLPFERSDTPSFEEINQKYAKRELRIVTETNREQLPNFVAAVQRAGWLNLKPFYQRRLRWMNDRKSKLIESFIMNIPVPPCFLYESEFARYEVMDGQQRISAILEFYENKFQLVGLEQWPELNGLIYAKLPSGIKQGLDRRSLSYIVLLKESTNSSDDEILLRQQVFERLNTGGVALENQEIRHCIYHNPFDELLVHLSHHPIMRSCWGLPLYSQEEDSNTPLKLLNDPQFSKMRDVEFVLRFFALRHVEHYRGGMQAFFDHYMVRSRRFDNEDIEILKNIFCITIELASAIYGDKLFRPWLANKNKWAPKPQIAYADAIMVGLSKVLNHRDTLLTKREQIIEATKLLVMEKPKGTFTGQRNTKEAVRDRIESFEAMLLTFVY